MSRLVSAYFVRRPQFDNPAVEKEVRDYTSGRDLKWVGNKMTFSFVGNKIDAIAESGAEGSADVLIDGKKPSEFPELYHASRVRGYPGIGWPIISRIDHRAPLILEDWTAIATDFSPDGKHFKFSVKGSVTGPDGEGNSDATFVSNSGRVVIEPDDWNMSYSFGLLQGPWAKDKKRPPFVVPENIVATWHVIPCFTDVYTPPVMPDPNVETPVVLAQGLTNGPHEIQLLGRNGPVRFKALRVYQPPLTALEESSPSLPVNLHLVPTFAPPPPKAE
jgi:hypothetical protein